MFAFLRRKLGPKCSLCGDPSDGGDHHLCKLMSLPNPAKDRIIEDAIETIRSTAEGLNEQGFGEWAQMNDKLADHFERRVKALA